MYLLKWMEGDRVQYVGIFRTQENGRAFMKKIPGYRLEICEEGGYRFENEIIVYESLPDLLMVEYEGYRVPVSRFSFDSDIAVIWIELDQLDTHVPEEAGSAERKDTEAFDSPAQKDSRAIASPVVAIGATRIDAYSINNEDVEDYVLRREKQYLSCKEMLEHMGYECSRECFGSEDGEAIFYRKRIQLDAGCDADCGEGEGWHFLLHLDPSFLEMDLEKEIPEMLFS